MPEDHFDRSATDAGLAEVELLSLAKPTRRMGTKKERRCKGTQYRVRVLHTIPMERLCFYFEARKKKFEKWIDGYALVDTITSYGNTILAIYVRDDRPDERRVDEIYKQVNGTWYYRGSRSYLSRDASGKLHVERNEQAYSFCFFPDDREEFSTIEDDPIEDDISLHQFLDSMLAKFESKND